MSVPISATIVWAVRSATPVIVAASVTPACPVGPVRLVPPADPRDNGHRLGEDRVESVSLASLEAFAAVDEPGEQALVGGEDAALIPEGGDVLIYGDGGAGKTTLSIDLACHLGAGKDWLGIPVPRRARVLLIENEGPRALFRRKLRRKLDGWAGPALDGHISVFQHPWSEFTFADATWRQVRRRSFLAFLRAARLVIFWPGFGRIRHAPSCRTTRQELRSEKQDTYPPQRT
jgi:hypothetical protein